MAQLYGRHTFDVFFPDKCVKHVCLLSIHVRTSSGEDHGTNKGEGTQAGYIPDTPGNVARAIMRTKPKQKQDWKFLKKFQAEETDLKAVDNPA